VREPTSTPVCVVADTIVRTVELGVTITNAALDADTTVVFCDLLTDGPGRCPGCGTVGQYRDRVERRLTDVPVAGHPLQLRVRVPALPVREQRLCAGGVLPRHQPPGPARLVDHPPLRAIRAAPADR
jgi:hypothetical protein